VYTECYRTCARVLHECHKSVACIRVLHECYTSVTRVSQDDHKSVIRVWHVHHLHVVVDHTDDLW
jgi:hypothetical protein